MADNFKTLQQTITDQITNAGGPGSIPASAHQAILLELLSKVGKYTGVPLMARREPNSGVVPVGTFFWNNNAMNAGANITVSFSATSSDLNPTTEQVRRCSPGSLIHFKDYSGRSALFKYVSHTEDKDTVDGDIVNLVMTPLTTNPNYVYSATDDEIAVLEFFTTNPNYIPFGTLTIRQSETNAGTGTFGLTAGDIGEGLLNNDIKLNYGVYVSGNPLDLASWDQATVDYYDPNDV